MFVCTSTVEEVFPSSGTECHNAKSLSESFRACFMDGEFMPTTWMAGPTSNPIHGWEGSYPWNTFIQWLAFLHL